MVGLTDYLSSPDRSFRSGGRLGDLATGSGAKGGSVQLANLFTQTSGVQNKSARRQCGGEFSFFPFSELSTLCRGWPLITINTVYTHTHAHTHSLYKHSQYTHTHTHTHSIHAGQNVAGLYCFLGWKQEAKVVLHLVLLIGLAGLMAI